ncbi:MAG: D-alanyl-D-alanine carboxypeptidase [Ruminococcaceae bacterium]|nr:D-alanyl-D-alanine carboxypeptidase [Oscillospiraceae bacterium]
MNTKGAGKYSRAAALIIALILMFSLFQAILIPTKVMADASLPVSEPTSSSAKDSVVYPEALVIEHSSESAIVIETGRGRVLYEKNTDLKLDIPAAYKIMAALLAVEKQPLDTKVTISNTVADAAYFESTLDNIRLRTGDKHSLEYLLLRLLFYDSDAAALALAESVTNDEADFVRQMNTRANTFGLKNTLFGSVTGQAAIAGSGSQVNSSPGNVEQNEPGASITTAYTTIADLAALTQRALQNERFSSMFRKQSEFIVVDGQNLVPMSNQLSSLWPYSEGRASGVFNSGDEKSTTIATGNVNGFGIISITANGDPNLAVADTLALFDAVERTYDYSPLVQAGQEFTGSQETTLDGETFGLIYQKDVQYVHPIGDHYIKPPAVYKSYGPYSRPIQNTMVVGQVVFELVDGTLITVDVVPDRQILSNINIVDQVLNLLQENRNLYYLLVGSLALLFLMLVSKLIAQIINLRDQRKN